MRKISDTIARLAAMRSVSFPSGTPDDGHLKPLVDFGSNPGALRAHVHVPSTLAAGAPLVVVLHGCTQNAAGYDKGSGWSQMADRHGFVVLFPEQQQHNNPNLCFNWFQTEDSRRDSGEPLSIRRMIAAVVAEHAIDPARIFVTGLSAGGAMTSVMLATYPEVFAGGAVIAGLPFGSATNVPQAFDRMRGHQIPDPQALTELVRGASDHAGQWPTLSVWHGSVDATVSLSNAKALVAQWGALHGTTAAPDRVETVDGHPRQAWCNAEGREVIEEYTITGMGHGTPLNAGEQGCGQSGPYMLEAGISSTQHICKFWGLTKKVRAASSPKPTVAPAAEVENRELVAAGTAVATKNGATEKPRLVRLPLTKPRQAPAGSPAGVRKVIEDALKAAGLLR